MTKHLIEFLHAPLWNKIALVSFAWARLKTQIFYRSAFGSMGTGTTLWRPLMLQNTRFVFLGRNVTIRDGARFDVTTKFGSQRFAPNVTIGDGSLFEQGFHLTAAGTINIGNQVACSRNVSVLGIQHEYEDITRAIIEQPLGVAPVSIGDGTLIGMNCVILPGVSIGKHCMIGANSVVSRDVPDFCVAAGSPARVIRRYEAAEQKWVKTVKPEEHG